MLKTVKWQKDLVVSIKVEGGLFVLAQMRDNHLLEIFDLFSEDDDWEGLDLNGQDVLFTIFVSLKNIKGIFSRVVSETEVVPNRRPVETRMLSAIFGSPGSTGARLIELSENYSNIGAEVIKESLSPTHDLELIHRYELCGMVGDPEKIVARIKRYKDTGVNWDSAKEFLFPGIQLPMR
ncbi:hypothetical protein D3C77_314250 [compost metagenome]